MRISGKGMSSSVIGRQLFGSKGSRGLDESMLEDDEEGSWANDGTGLRARDVESRYHNIYEDRMNPFEEVLEVRQICLCYD